MATREEIERRAELQKQIDMMRAIAAVMAGGDRTTYDNLDDVEDALRHARSMIEGEIKGGGCHAQGVRAAEKAIADRLGRIYGISLALEMIAKMRADQAAQCGDRTATEN
jgi:hypothetical protein